MKSRPWLVFFCCAICTRASADSVSIRQAPWLDCLLEPRHVVDLSFPVSGVVAAIMADRGQLVEAGQVLASLESSVERAAVEQASLQASSEGAILARQASLRFATRYMDRIRELYVSDGISITDKEQAETDLILAHMELKQAEEAKEVAIKSLRRAEAILERRSIRSPISGVVAERHVSAGEFVKEEPVISVVQLDPLKLEVTAPAAMVGGIVAGMTAEVIPGSPMTGSYTATVVAVDPFVDVEHDSFGVLLELPNKGHGLPSGLPCRLRFQLAEPLPRSAAEQHDSVTPRSQDLFVASGGRTRLPQQAKTGAGGGLSAEEMAAITGDWGGHGVTETSSTGRASPTKDTENPHLSCALLGPFSSEQQIDRARDGLAGGGGRAVAQRDRVVESDGFSVFAPRQPSSAAQRELLSRLADLDVTDYVVLENGTYAGRVALGHFVQLSRAEKHLEMLAKRGIASEIEPRFRRRPGLWLEIRPAILAEQAAPILRNLEAEWPGLELDVDDCTVLRGQRGSGALVSSR